ncbi:hypothetical protein B0O99DRAFT_546343 [Bisporella sp. PMI_857]|nr:hypothetical protein B0O99DRAFT_546343 [Bisporella sp. PMI_857]
MILHAKRLRPLLTLILHSPAGKVFLSSLALWILSFAYCSHRYWRDPHSAFFSSTHVYDLQYSESRNTQADAFIEAANHPGTIKLKKASGKPEICAAFVTVQRQGKAYIAQAIASMLEGLTDGEREKLYSYVLFADTRPEVHDIWNATWLREAVDKAEGYDVSTETLTHLKELEEKRNFYEKGVFDYLYALDTCYKTEAPYIAIFEDDIILADGWLARTLHALHHEIEPLAKPGGPFNNWLYFRLFYTETSIQWGAEDFWYANLPLTFFLSSLGTSIAMISTRLLIPRTRNTLDNYSVAVLSLLTIPAFVALFFMIGKASLIHQNTNGVFVLNKYGCCTQAMVFARAQLPALTAHLRELKSGQTDTILENYADANNMQRLALAPQVAQHVGLVSSRDNTVDNARSTWAFWFEENDPVWLRTEHEMLLKEGI